MVLMSGKHIRRTDLLTDCRFHGWDANDAMHAVQTDQILKRYTPFHSTQCTVQHAVGKGLKIYWDSNEFWLFNTHEIYFITKY